MSELIIVVSSCSMLEFSQLLGELNVVVSSWSKLEFSQLLGELNRGYLQLVEAGSLSAQLCELNQVYQLLK